MCTAKYLWRSSKHTYTHYQASTHTQASLLEAELLTMYTHIFRTSVEEPSHCCTKIWARCAAWLAASIWLTAGEALPVRDSRTIRAAPALAIQLRIRPMRAHMCTCVSAQSYVYEGSPFAGYPVLHMVIA